MNLFNLFKSKKGDSSKNKSKSNTMSAIDFLDDCARDRLCGYSLMDCEAYKSNRRVQCNKCRKSFNSTEWVLKFGNSYMVICPNCKNSLGTLP